MDFKQLQQLSECIHDVWIITGALSNHSWLQFPSQLRLGLLLLRAKLGLLVLTQLAQPSPFISKWRERLNEAGITAESLMLQHISAHNVVYAFIQFDIHHPFTFSTKTRHFYIGSTSQTFSQRYASRLRKFKQLSAGKLVKAEISLQYWMSTGTFDHYIGFPFVFCSNEHECRIRELSCIAKWQPLLNYHSAIDSLLNFGMFKSTVKDSQSTDKMPRPRACANVSEPHA